MALSPRDDYSAGPDTRATLSPGSSINGKLELLRDEDWIKVHVDAQYGPPSNVVQVSTAERAAMDTGVASRQIERDATGEYQVVLLVNGEASVTKKFSVK